MWDLDLGRPLPGGSASYVVAATHRPTGADRVLKVGLPDGGIEAQAAVLEAADGVGYARLFGHDESAQALLLESLGPSLDRTPGRVEDQLATLTDTLALAWRVPPERVPITLVDGRAAQLLELLATRSRTVPVDPRVLGRATAYAEELAATHDPAADVVAHGDPHPANALRVREPRPGAETGYVLVDPGGLRTEPAHDLGVILRDWSRRILAAGSDIEAQRLLRGWCALVGERTGIDPDRIWRWAFLERVSIGMYVCSFGAERVGRMFLDSAVRLLE